MVQVQQRTAAAFEIQLIHIQGSLKGTINSFREDRITIGRQPGCTLQFPPDEPGVSREHATIEREGNQFRLIDTSKYGTLVNGKQAGDATYLRSGDVIEISPGGPKFSFHAEVAEGAAAPLPEPEVQPQPVAPPRPELTHQPQPVQPLPDPLPQQPVYVAPPAQPQPAAPPPPRPVQQPERAKVPLVIQFGPVIKTYNELPVVIGSDANADFVLQFPGISGRHLQIFHTRGAYWVKNLAGVGIVTVNREKIDLQVQLTPHDEIECSPGGPMFRFIGEGRLVEIEREQAAPWSAPAAPPSSPAASTGNNDAGDGFLSKLFKGFKK